MARNKYPEETKKKIIEAAYQLFATKGYEAVVMQDIIDKAGFSRGAVYHHFSDKNEILNEVTATIFAYDNSFYEALMTKEMSARQRIDEIVNYVVSDKKKQEMSYGLWVQKNPKTLYTNVKNTIQKASPAIAQIVKQGISEGICDTEFPEEAAELIMLLLNIWLDPSLFDRTEEQFNKKIDFLIDTLDKIGVSLLSEETTKILRNYYLDFLRHTNGGHICEK